MLSLLRERKNSRETTRLGQNHNDKRKQTNSVRFGQKRAFLATKKGQSRAKMGQKNRQTKPNPGETGGNQKFRQILVLDRPTLDNTLKVASSNMFFLKYLLLKRNLKKILKIKVNNSFSLLEMNITSEPFLLKPFIHS